MSNRGYVASIAHCAKPVTDRSVDRSCIRANFLYPSLDLISLGLEARYRYQAYRTPINNIPVTNSNSDLKLEYGMLGTGT
jgi:hypothetical protein